MKIIKVTYKTSPEYAETNKANISVVMVDLQAIGSPGINYHVCCGADGQTFTHTAFFESEEANKVLLELPAFKHFQEQLKASGPVEAPKQEIMTFVRSSKAMF